MSETYSATRAYVTMNNTNLASSYGLQLTSYSVGSPAPLVKLIDVPGRPGKLDATLALNGKVNYTSRKITMTFHVRNNSYPDFQTLLSTLLKLFSGIESKVVFSTDPSWYYKGRFTVDHKKTNPITSTITLTCADAHPYKMEAYEVSGTISSSGYVTAVGKDYNGTVTIYCSSAMSVTFGGKTYQLSSGNNVVRELHISSGNNSLRFTGSGTVRISYERGVL